ncbi:MAG: alcohol dehydrogenase catalytic domain-containing protein [Gaiella sp.]
MLAARLHPGRSTLSLEDVSTPEPVGTEVLVEVIACGVCRSDLHILDGAFRDTMQLPVTMGHEIVGRVAAAGPYAGAVPLDEHVAVMAGWGCGHCRTCVSGREQICPDGNEAGATRDGGFAEYVLVPHRRHLVSLDGLDPLQATPLGCAALSAFAAVRRVAPAVLPGAAVVVIGIGGLGGFAVQLVPALTGGRVIAVDSNPERLAQAQALGATAILADAQAPAHIRELTGGDGAAAVIDLVGTDETLALAAGVVGRRGIVALLGLAGGSFRFSFESLAPEASLTTVVAGTIADLHDVARLARQGAIHAPVTLYPLAEIDRALADLAAGIVIGRAAVVPGTPR